MTPPERRTPARKITLPLTEQDVDQLRAGDEVLLTGTIYTGRDAAHRRLAEALQSGNELPVDLRGQIIYYVGPAPARPGQIIGPAGPTTSGRMDACTPALLRYGLRGMIGKGTRSTEVRQAMIAHRALYFAAIGGAASLLSQRIHRAEIAAYEDLGPEAIYLLEVVDFPVFVVNDSRGNDLYAEGQRQYAG